MAPAAWVRESFRVYVGNATAVRDFRTQLRGNRAVWIWTFYLLVLVGFAMLFYSTTVESGQISVSEAQRRLQTYYQSTMILLGVLISTIAPALTASAVVSERQRRSLDLVFSAPVSPKYLLVGKLISSYRYVWMLLVLSLPVTASCVVMGGATWVDVLQAYALLSLDALLFTAIALLFSTICRTVIAAFIWSYIAVIAYLVATTGLASISAMAMYFHRGTEAPFSIGLSPFVVSYAAGTTMKIGSFQVPNLLLVAIYTLFVCRLLLLGAASNLSPAGSKETVALRVQGIFGYGLAAFLFAFGAAGVFGGGSLGAPRSILWLGVGGSLASWIVFAGLLVPYITCFGKDAESKFQLDGAFNWKRVFAGTPSGGLPYLICLVSGSTLGATLGGYFGFGELPPVRFLVLALWGIALMFSAWSLGRLTSAMSQSLRTARALHYGALVVVWLLPLPFLSAMGRRDQLDFSAWDLYPITPLATWSQHPIRTLGLALAMAAVGYLIYRESAGMVRRRSTLRGSYEEAA